MWQSPDEIEIIKVDRAFRIKDMPLGNKVYVIDNYLETSIHHWLDKSISDAGIWSKTNQVRGDSPTGLPHHSLWGASYFVGQEEDGQLKLGECSKLQSLPGKYLNRRICTDFGFKWKRFQGAVERDKLIITIKLISVSLSNFKKLFTKIFIYIY